MLVSMLAARWPLRREESFHILTKDKGATSTVEIEVTVLGLVLLIQLPLTQSVL